MVGTLLLPEASLSDVVMAPRAETTDETVRVTILREYTTEPIVPYLEFGLQEMGFDSAITHSNYTLLPGDLDNMELWEQNPNYILFMPNFDLLTGRHPGQYFESTAKNYIDLKEAFLQHCLRIFVSSRERTDVPIFVVIPPAPLPFAQTTTESSDGLPLTVAHFDDLVHSLEQDIAEFSRIELINLQDVFQYSGIGACLDRRRQFTNLTPYTLIGFREIATSVLNRIRALTGKGKKVLVLDCDETIWDGIAGEGGIENLSLDPQRYPDSAHLELQAYAKFLTKTGVLVCLVSKNEPATVWSVFDHHQGMILTRDDIVTERINWKPKSENIKSISDELNLNLDSFVFIDNSPAEIEEVKMSFPMVSTVLVTEDRLAELPALIHRCGWFQRASLTDTDRARTTLYKSDKNRDERRYEAVDHDTFLASLDMKAIINTGSSVDVGRAAQMCSRTNQFNLTTKRYSRDEIVSFIENPDCFVAVLNLDDCFGSLGDVCLLIGWRRSRDFVVDTLLLSCRVFGRYCEALVLQAAVDHAKAQDCDRMVGYYDPTSKNGLVEEFWDSHGFSVTTDGARRQTAKIHVEGLSIPHPSVYKSIHVQSTRG